jgi:lipoprotein-anchoring transpeptidase ErfK/SrfK
VIARLTARTEFGSPRVLAVTAQRRGWLEVIATALPNGERGWVRAASARVRGTNFALVVDRSARRAELRHGNRVLRRIKVAVGQPGNETPLGTFAVTDKLTPNADTSPYGCCIVALSGHQPRLPASWGGGDRLAFHGTTAPGSIGGRTSLGCLRASARDMRALLDRVPLGAPVIIRA